MYLLVKLDKWESNVDKIKAAINQEHKIKIILESFLTDFSLNEAMLFRYSPIDHLAEGILSATKSEFKHISSIRDDITSIPAIFKAIKTRTPQYYEGNNFHLNISKKYIIADNQDALLVVPIIFNQVVIGYFLGSQFKKPFDLKLLIEATLFSKDIGEILFNQFNFIEEAEIKLSKREYEVMKCTASGYSTKQIAHILEISETTIKQYIKSVMAKTNTLNRTHAVAFLIQKNILK
ncbi:helix-turn-helix transcriptional regulator [Cytobacillus sp. FSL W7-1323]|uniref:helix-turn-helix transcriptional regulator n=1 Tax=Cytobacillus TaxID=2675230 RepID=UPI0027D7A2E4|nr:MULTISPECIES: helix-turn-helix transcriptional regulator [Cytobacillus]MEA1852349.1 helix-turn-helix transcriptional regulator [Cytobacillus sp. OWB-43]